MKKESSMKEDKPMETKNSKKRVVVRIGAWQAIYPWFEITKITMMYVKVNVAKLLSWTLYLIQT